MNCLTGPYVLLWKRGPSVLTAGEMKITMDKRISLVNGFDMEIQNVRPQDGGDYVCQLSTYTPEEQVHTLEILGKHLFKCLKNHNIRHTIPDKCG